MLVAILERGLTAKYGINSSDKKKPNGKKSSMESHQEGHAQSTSVKWNSELHQRRRREWCEVVVIVDNYCASSVHDPDKATYPGLSRRMNRR